MAVTVEVGTGTITSTEGNAEEVQATIAALDASSKDAKPATDADDPGQSRTEPDGTGTEIAEKPAPAIVQDRESDGKFKVGGKKDAQSRIAHVTWEREEARRQAAAERESRERLERELEAYRQGKLAGEPAEPYRAPTPATDGRPSEDAVGTTYQTYADYVEAVADWKVEQRFKAQQERVQQAEGERAHQTQRSAHHERMATWRASNPTQAAEFDDLTKTPSPDLSPAMVSAILDSTQGPALLHFLASHPEECLQLMVEAKDLPLSAAQWVRRVLESKVTAPAAPSGPAPAVTRSPVPAPIQPVGASPVVSEVDTSTLKGRAYVEAENAKELARLRRQRGML